MSSFVLSSSNTVEQNTKILSSEIASYSEYILSILDVFKMLNMNDASYYADFLKHLRSIEISELINKQLVFYDGRLVEADSVTSLQRIEIPEFKLEAIANTDDERRYLFEYAFDSYNQQLQDFISEVYASTSILSPLDYEEAMSRADRLLVKNKEQIDILLDRTSYSKNIVIDIRPSRYNANDEDVVYLDLMLEYTPPPSPAPEPAPSVI